eukprot:Nk52_evm45s2209 gene=Nk52_evmTU45s2209
MNNRLSFVVLLCALVLFTVAQTTCGLRISFKNPTVGQILEFAREQDNIDGHKVLENVNRFIRFSREPVPRQDKYLAAQSASKSRFEKRNDQSPTMTIPDYDSEAEQQIRAQTLLGIQSVIENVERAYSVIPFPEVYKMPNGLAFDNLTNTEATATLLILKDLGIVSATANPGQSEFVAGTLLGSNPPIDTLEDLEALYNLFTDALPVPFSLKNWRDDANFADRRLTFAPHLLKRATSLHFEVDLTKDEIESLCGVSKTVEQLLKSKKIFEVNMSDFGKYNDASAPYKYISGAHGLFCDGKKGLMPVAIRLDNEIVYTPIKSTESEWTLAKIAMNAAEQCWQNGVHFYKAHVWLEPVRVEMYRHISVNHPLYQLLEYHFKLLFGTTSLGLTTLFTDNTPLDNFFGWGAPGMMAMMTDFLDDSQREITTPFPDSLKRRGIHTLKNNRFAEIGMEYYKAIKSFVTRYVERMYHTNSELVNDMEVQSWAAAVQSPSGGDFQRFPSKFEKRKELIEIVTNMVFQTTFKHNTMSSDLVWHGMGLPNAPFALWAPLPTEHGVEVNLRQYLSPNLQVILAEIAQSQAFYRNIRAEDNMLNIYTEHIPQFHDFAPDIIWSLRNDIRKLKDKYDSMEAKRAVGKPRYNAGDPVRCPTHSWV